MKHHRYRLSHHWVLALVTAGLLVASVPGSANAQRGRTDDGRRIERKSDARASKNARASQKGAKAKAKVERRSNSRNGSERGSVRGGDNRGSGGVRSSGRDRDRAVRSGKSSGKRSGGTISGDRDRRSGDWNRGDRSDRRNGNWNRDDRRDRRNGNWNRRDDRRHGGGAVFVPPGLAKKHVKYHHRRAHRTRVDVRINWPWVVRYEQHWHPRVRARHVIHVDAGWGTSRRSARMEFETVYRQRVRHANRDYAVIDIDLEEVVIYRDGRYIGRVDRIPGHLSGATATVWRNGDLEYDRDIFVVGNSFTGFELIAEEYRPNGRTRVRAGIVDLHSGRVRSVGHSRLYDPYYPDRFYAQSLLPEDVAW